MSVFLTGDDPYKIHWNDGRLVTDISSITGNTFPYGGTSLGIVKRASMSREQDSSARFSSEGFGGPATAWEVRMLPRLLLDAILIEWNDEVLQWAFGVSALVTGGDTGEQSVLEVIGDHGELVNTVHSLTFVPRDQDQGVWTHLFAATEVTVTVDEQIHQVRQRLEIPIQVEARPDGTGRMRWRGKKTDLASLLSI